MVWIMNLISCENCGVVVDAEKAGFVNPLEMFDANRVAKEGLTAWSSECDDYVPMVLCPVCGKEILKED